MSGAPGRLVTFLADELDALEPVFLGFLDDELCGVVEPLGASRPVVSRHDLQVVLGDLSRELVVEQPERLFVDENVDS